MKQSFDKILPRFIGQTIAVWGVTFKGGTEDVRESPALELITLLLNEGAEVNAYDPSFAPNAPERVRERLKPTALDAAAGADALAILTDWHEFQEVPLAEVRATMRGDVLFDGRNVLSREKAEYAGFVYIGVGRGRPTSPAAGRSVVAA